jgi:hypothetical protein
MFFTALDQGLFACLQVLMPYRLGLCVLRRTYSQDYGILFHVVILSIYIYIHIYMHIYICLSSSTGHLRLSFRAVYHVERKIRRCVLRVRLLPGQNSCRLLLPGFYIYTLINIIVYRYFIFHIIIIMWQKSF